MISKLEGQFGTSAGASINTSSFRNVIEDHLEYLRKHELTQTVDITAHEANVYMFDWIGLLKKHNIPVELHWIVIRLNGGESYTDVGDEARSILVPDGSEVNRLLQMHVSVKRKK